MIAHRDNEFSRGEDREEIGEGEGDKETAAEFFVKEVGNIEVIRGAGDKKGCKSHIFIAADSEVKLETVKAGGT